MERNQIPNSWAEMLNAQKSSGKSATVWCKENGIPLSTFYYRRKRVQEQKAEETESSEKETVQEIVKIAIKKPNKYEVPFAVSKSSSEKIRMIKGDMLFEFPVSATAEVLSAVMRGGGEIC